MDMDALQKKAPKYVCPVCGIPCYSPYCYYCWRWIDPDNPQPRMDRITAWLPTPVGVAMMLSLKLAGAAVRGVASLVHRHQKQQEMADGEQQAHEAFEAGVRLYDEKRYAEATECFHRAVTNRPEDYATWHNLGDCHMACGRYRDAITCYRAATEYFPNASNPAWEALKHAEDTLARAEDGAPETSGITGNPDSPP